MDLSSSNLARDVKTRQLPGGPGGADADACVEVEVGSRQGSYSEPVEEDPVGVI